MVDYTQEQLKKRDLVKDHLQPLLMTLDHDIDEVQYEVTKSGLELVHIIYYQDPVLHITDHCIDTVNVTGDSMTALVCDVIAAFRWR